MTSQTLLSILTLSAIAAAQGPLTFAYQAIEMPTPAPPALPGVDAAVACGSFVPRHPGRSAVVQRDGRLYWSFEPTVFRGAGEVPMPVTAPAFGAGEAIGTLEAIAGGRDRLAVVHTGGLDIWRYESPGTTLPAGGFVSVAKDGVDATFVGGLSVRCGTHVVSGTEHNHVVVLGPNWVQGAEILPDEDILAGVRGYIGAGATLLDAVPVQWIAGGDPELGVLTTTGLFVYDMLGNYLDGEFFASTNGRLCATRADGMAALCAVVDSGSDYVLRTWRNDDTLTTSAGFALPAAPEGIVTLDLDADEQLDVVVSSTDSIVRCFPGTTTGPVAGSYQVDVAIVDPASLPPSPADNLAAPTVDDIDYDGYQDLVFAHTATNELVVMTSVSRQFQIEAMNQPDPGEAREEMEAPVGMFHTTDANWAFPSTTPTLDGLGLRVRLPSWVSSDYVLRVYKYDASGGSVEGAAVAAYDYPLLASYGDCVFDIIVPVPPVTSTSAADEFVFEVLLVGVGNAVGDASPSYIVDYQLAAGDVQNLSRWWDEIFEFFGEWGWPWTRAWACEEDVTSEQWADPNWAPTVPTTATNPGNGDPPTETAARYIGVIVEVDVELSTDPSFPISEVLSNGTPR